MTVPHKALLVLTCTIALATSVQSATPAVALARPTIDVALNSDGSGTLTAEPPGAWEWKNCGTDLTGCMPVGTGTQVSTAGSPEGTIFTATLGGRTLISPRWAGNVFFARPPSLQGMVRANEFVAPDNGDWRGGWPGQIGITQLAACRNPDGSDCITLSNYHFPCVANGGMHPGGAVLDPVLTDWYLRLAEQVEILGSGPLILHPEEEEPFPASTISSVTMLGQIAPATGPRTADCGVPPQLQASISKRGVATVRCGLGCRAVLIAKRGRHRARVVRQLSPILFSLAPKQLPRLRLRLRSLARLGSGRARIVVKIDGRRAAQRTVPLSTPAQKGAM